MPKISVIVPVYNVEKYLNKCVDSILNQTFEDFELILVDDGSPDNCGNICDEYAQKDNRVKVIHKKNGGLSDARNAGIDCAIGEWLSFIDSDDWVENNFLEILYSNAVKYQAEIVIVNLHKVFDEKCEHAIPVNEICCNGIESLNYLYGTQSVYMNVAWNKLYKKSLFDNVRYPVGKFHEDGFTTYKLLNMCKKVYMSNCDLYCYYQRNNSIMNNKFSENRVDEYFVYCERRKFFSEHNLKKSFIENERTILSCIFSLTTRIFKSDLTEAFKKKYYKMFRKDLKKNYKFLVENISIKQKISLDIYIVSPYAFIFTYYIKNELRQIKEKTKNFRIWKNFLLKCIYAKIFHKNKYAFYMMAPIGGNLGDQALTFSTETLLNDIYFIEMPVAYMALYCKHMKKLKKLINKNLILFSAGGYLGTLWFDEVEVYTRILLENFRNNRIIILPQTIFYEDTDWGKTELKRSQEIYNSCKNLTIFAREKISYNFMKKLYNDVKLMPDLVLALNISIPDIKQRGVLMALRHDCEKTLNSEKEKKIHNVLKKYFNDVSYTDTVVPGEITSKERYCAIKRKIEQFASVQLVVTDRLHGMVFAAIAGTPCAVLKSMSYKLEGCYEWIEELEYIKFVSSEEELTEFIKKKVGQKYKYNNKYLSKYYESLKVYVYDSLKEIQ